MIVVASDVECSSLVGGDFIVMKKEGYAGYVAG